MTASHTIQDAGRFAVLAHETDEGVHFDMLFEAGPRLATWSLERDPAGPGPIPGRRIADHRRRYLAFEGPISGGRGRVRIADAGTFRLLARATGRVEVELHGARTSGRFELVEGPGGEWRFQAIARF